jgi:hypothetical protein
MEKYIKINEGLIKSLKEHKITYEESEIVDNTDELEQSKKEVEKLTQEIATSKEGFEKLTQEIATSKEVINQYKDLFNSKDIKQEKKVKFESAYLKKLKVQHDIK